MEGDKTIKVKNVEFNIIKLVTIENVYGVWAEDFPPLLTKRKTK